ncbi:MAG TPA: hypothetical protein VNO17_01555 [Actinomycetota bacterium]|nr:hypothetical protein [Actinomycetota bacterium]
MERISFGGRGSFNWRKGRLHVEEDQGREYVYFSCGCGRPPWVIRATKFGRLRAELGEGEGVARLVV